MSFTLECYIIAAAISFQGFASRDEFCKSMQTKSDTEIIDTINNLAQEIVQFEWFDNQRTVQQTK